MFGRFLNIPLLDHQIKYFWLLFRYMSRYSRGRYLYQTVFKEDGNHDNIWLHGQANITSSYDFQVKQKNTSISKQAI